MCYLPKYIEIWCFLCPSYHVQANLKYYVLVQEPITIQNAGERLQTRCERETLSRFPKTRAILFTIRTHMHKLDTFEDKPHKVISLLYSSLSVKVACRSSLGINGVICSVLSFRVMLHTGMGAGPCSAQPASRTGQVQDNCCIQGPGPGLPR